MTKVCRVCKLDKEEDDFNWRNKAKGYRHTICRSCWKGYVKKHYEENKEVYINRATNRHKQLKEDNTRNMLIYLSSHPCVDCGIDDIHLLEFDHVQGEKKFGISDALSKRSWDTIREEIKKCEVRCANCHRKRHTVENDWRNIESLGNPSSSSE